MSTQKHRHYFKQNYALYPVIYDKLRDMGVKFTVCLNFLFFLIFYPDRRNLSFIDNYFFSMIKLKN